MWKILLFLGLRMLSLYLQQCKHTWQLLVTYANEGDTFILYLCVSTWLSSDLSLLSTKTLFYLDPLDSFSVMLLSNMNTISYKYFLMIPAREPDFKFLKVKTVLFLVINLSTIATTSSPWHNMLLFILYYKLDTGMFFFGVTCINNDLLLLNCHAKR